MWFCFVIRCISDIFSFVTHFPFKDFFTLLSHFCRTFRMCITVTSWVRKTDAENEFTNTCCCFRRGRIVWSFPSNVFFIQLKDFCSWCAGCNGFKSFVLVFKHCTTVKLLKSKYREMTVQNQLCLAVLIRTLNIKLEKVLYQSFVVGWFSYPVNGWGRQPYCILQR